jgi:hypothetical protein
MPTFVGRLLPTAFGFVAHECPANQPDRNIVDCENPTLEWSIPKDKLDLRRHQTNTAHVVCRIAAPQSLVQREMGRCKAVEQRLAFHDAPRCRAPFSAKRKPPKLFA